MDGSAFTAQEKKHFWMKKYLKEHVFEFVISLLFCILFTLLLLYICKAESYIPGVVFAVVFRCAAAVNHLRLYKKERSDAGIGEEP